MQYQVQLAVLACVLSLAACAHDLSEAYPFKATLNTAENGGLYELYWAFDNAAETISFAVRVQTTGWVGFGLSPNGQMPNSDVVIGWVDNGEVYFTVSLVYNFSELLYTLCICTLWRRVVYRYAVKLIHE